MVPDAEDTVDVGNGLANGEIGEDSGGVLHEAGWDAFMTGSSFAKVHFVMSREIAPDIIILQVIYSLT